MAYIAGSCKKTGGSKRNYFFGNIPAFPFLKHIGQKFFLFVFTAIFSVSSGTAVASTPILIESQDLIRVLWRHIGNDSAPPEGAYHFSLSHRENPEEATDIVLMHEGTEVGRTDASPILDQIHPYLYAAARPQQKEVSFFQLTPYRRLPYLRPPGHDWFDLYNRLGSWKEGFHFSTGYTAIEMGAPFYTERTWKYEWVQRYKMFFAGLGCFFSSSKGSPFITWGPDGAQSSKNMGWNLSAGVPGFRLEMLAFTSDMPEYTWMEPKLQQTRNNQDGRLLKSREILPTGSHTYYMREGAVNIKAGYFQYRGVFNPGSYISTVHSIWFREIPAGFGEWGAGFDAASGMAVPGISLALIPFRLSISRYLPRPFSVSIKPVNFTFYFNNFSKWHATLSFQAWWSPSLARIKLEP